MTNELHKRLEEAANEIYPVSEIYNDLAMEFVDVNGGLREAFQGGGEVGAEYGYKEAIAQCKEWLETNIANQVEMMCAEGPLMMGKTTFLADFEEAMKKLWEEKK